MDQRLKLDAWGPAIAIVKNMLRCKPQIYKDKFDTGKGDSAVAAVGVSVASHVTDVGQLPVSVRSTLRCRTGTTYHAELRVQEMNRRMKGAE